MDDFYTWMTKDVRILKARLGGKVLEEKEVSLRQRRLKAIYGAIDRAEPLQIDAPQTPRAAMSSLVEGLATSTSPSRDRDVYVKFWCII